MPSRTPNPTKKTRRDFLKIAAASVALPLALPGARTARASVSSPEDKSPPPPGLEFLALSRLAFGPNETDLRVFESMGDTPDKRLSRWVREQLDPEKIIDADCNHRIATAALPTLQKPLKTLWQDHKVAVDRFRDMEKNRPSPWPSPSPTASPVVMQDLGKLRQQPVRETEIATWIRAVYSRRQLFEVMADFWHNHFSVYGWDDAIAPTFVHYDRDVIRQHAFGNFREMLEAVAKSPAMLFYLDNSVNQSGNPNENFARELFELHTLGAENYLGTMDRERVAGFAGGLPVGYVDGDVYEAARAFTGWRVDTGAHSDETGEFAFFEPWHDRFQKIVLGRHLREYGPPMKDGRDVLDLVASHPGTARFVCRKLCTRLVSDHPSERLVRSAAKIFHEKRKSRDQIAQVVQFIVLSPEFKNTFGQKIKRPFEVVAGLLRATEADFHPTEQFQKEYQRTGQRLFQWRTPDGYPDAHEKWGGASSMLERWRICNLLVQGKIDGTKIPLASTKPLGAQTPNEIARYWSLRLLSRSMGDESLVAVSELLAQGRDSNAPLSASLIDERMPAAVALILMSPEFQWR